VLGKSVNNWLLFDTLVSSQLVMFCDARLRLFQNFESFRVLVCGGDGSVSWVLTEIDRLGLHKQVCPHLLGLCLVSSTTDDWLWMQIIVVGKNNSIPNRWSFFSWKIFKNLVSQFWKLEKKTSWIKSENRSSEYRWSYVMLVTVTKQCEDLAFHEWWTYLNIQINLDLFNNNNNNNRR